MAVPIRIGLPPSTDPAAPFVLHAVSNRLAGDLDNAELWLNLAAQAFRELGLPNTSRIYRREARAVAYARFNQDAPPDDDYDGDSEVEDLV